MKSSNTSTLADCIYHHLKDKEISYIWLRREIDTEWAYIGVGRKKVLNISPNQVSPNLLDELESLIKEEDSQHIGAGFLSYDAYRHFEKMPWAETKEPDLFFIIPEKVIEIKKHGDKFYIDNKEILKDQTPKTTPLVAQIEDNPELYSKTSLKEYIKRVHLLQEHIRAGDSFQLVTANDFSVNFGLKKPLHSFRDLCNLNPSPFSFYIDCSTFKLFGASPETYLNTEGERVYMKPVAGTFKSEGISPEEAKRNFSLDEKEKAEHIMLVDHTRNDLGVTASSCSVRVDQFMNVESYSNVHHLISKVSSEIDSSFSIFDTFKTCFPISTLSGTPKIRSAQILYNVEKCLRGVFGGSFFVLGKENGKLSMESTVIIRSLVCYPDRTQITAGGGIVFDSTAEREYRESFWKATPALSIAYAEKINET